MNRSIKKLIALAISITSVISAATFSAGAAATSISYTGEAITPDIILYDDDLLLIEGQDYDLSYENNINVGTATIIATFKGNYSGSTRATFEITPKAISADDVAFSEIEAEYVFTDAPIEPEPAIKLGDIILVSGQDYKLEYTDNTHPGEATIKAVFKGNYSGEASVNFIIRAKDVSNDENLTASEIPAQTYTGEPIEPKPEIKYGDKTLAEGTDYDLEYTNNTDVGDAVVKVIFKNDYTGEKGYAFTIAAKSVTDENTEVSGVEDTVFTGKGIAPALTIKVDGRELTENADYMVSYNNNKDVGTATGTIDFIGNYIGEKSISFNITPFIVNDDNVRLSEIPDQTYTGSAITPAVTITIIRK